MRFSRALVAAITSTALLGATVTAAGARPYEKAGSEAPDAAAPAPGAAERLPTKTPIKHFVTLMQENHTFDNYFGTYPGANGYPKGTCLPVAPTTPGQGCVKPFHLGEQPVLDLGHSKEIFDAQYRGGKMDGFVAAMGDNTQTGRQTAGYYDDRDLPYYWNIADQYVLFDRFFSSSNGGSVRNHFYWIAGAPGNRAADSLRPEGFDDVPTIFDRLQASGVSWKFYIQNYDPKINFRNPEVEGNRAAQMIWAPVLNYNRFLDDPALHDRIVPLNQYYDDLAAGTLPAVSYIVPSGASEHPPGSIQAGERFVRSLIGSLMESSAWSTSAFSWSYDDWGGWYDHVKPPQVDPYGYGFRVPALLVSPYARRGHVDSTTSDFTSYLAFIEANWGVKPLDERDRKANDLMSAFDFEKPPRSPVLVGLARTTPPLSVPRKGIIYTSYSLALFLALVLIGVTMRASAAGRKPRIRRPAGQGSS